MNVEKSWSGRGAGGERIEGEQRKEGISGVSGNSVVYTTQQV